MPKEEMVPTVVNQEKGALIPPAPTTPPPSNLDLFLKEIDEAGKKYGYGLIAVIKPYLQDNGAYSFKTEILPFELPKAIGKK